MSLEQALAANTAAVEALTAAIKAGGTTPSSGSTSGKTETKPKAEAKSKPKSAHSREDMAALLTKVKETFDATAAKTIIKEVGGSEKMADIADDKIDAVYDAAKAKLEASEDNGDDM